MSVICYNDNDMEGESLITLEEYILKVDALLIELRHLLKGVTGLKDLSDIELQEKYPVFFKRSNELFTNLVNKKIDKETERLVEETGISNKSLSQNSLEEDEEEILKAKYESLFNEEAFKNLTHLQKQYLLKSTELMMFMGFECLQKIGKKNHKVLTDFFNKLKQDYQL